jgi:hypothetical protein
MRTFLCKKWLFLRKPVLDARGLEHLSEGTRTPCEALPRLKLFVRPENVSFHG